MWYPLFGNDVIPCPSKVPSSSWSDIRYLKNIYHNRKQNYPYIGRYNHLWFVAYSYVIYICIYILYVYIYILILPVSNVTKCNTHIFLLSSMVNFAAILNMKEYYHISYSSFESSSHNLNNRKEKDGFVMSHLDFNL